MRCEAEHTGVFATSKETEEIQKLHEEARRTPVIATSVAEGMAGRDAASYAHKRCRDKLQELAKVHGLPDFEGYYGFTPEGEFVK